MCYRPVVVNTHTITHTHECTCFRARAQVAEAAERGVLLPPSSTTLGSAAGGGGRGGKKARGAGEFMLK